MDKANKYCRPFQSQKHQSNPNLSKTGTNTQPKEFPKKMSTRDSALSVEMTLMETSEPSPIHDNASGQKFQDYKQYSQAQQPNFLTRKLYIY